MRDIMARLDSFEKEVVILKAFRAAVERVNPQVAKAAAEIAAERKQAEMELSPDLEHTLTPDEFGELYQVQALQPHGRIRMDRALSVHSIDDLMRYAHLMHRECSTRTAQRAAALNNAPFGFGRMPSIEVLRKYYEWSFHDVSSVEPPRDHDSLLHFDGLIRRIYLRHVEVTPLLAKGIVEFAQRESITRKRLSEEPVLFDAYSPLQEMFEEFVRGRVTLRFMVNHYMYLSTKILRPDMSAFDGATQPHFFGHQESQFHGFICRETSMVTLVQHAIEAVKREFSAYDADQLPEISLRVAGDETRTFPCPPMFVQQSIAAMIDTAVHANLDRSEETGALCSPIEIVVAQAPKASEVSVRVSDTAGGMPLDVVPRSLTLLSCCEGPPGAIGIPYAAVAAMKLGGALNVASIEGYGTDRVLHLPYKLVPEL